MKKLTIACIDDKEEELVKAQKAVEKKGHKFIKIVAKGRMMTWIMKIQHADGVITDLHFNPHQKRCSGKFLPKRLEKEIPKDPFEALDFDFLNSVPGRRINYSWKIYRNEQPPAGLLVVVHSLFLGKPVVICTNAAEKGGHHEKAISWIHDAYVCAAPETFGWEEDKNWDRAVKILEERFNS